VPERARQLAGRLAEAFDYDQRLAVRQSAALDRLREGNEQLWSGLHPEALGLLYDDTHAEGISEQATIRSRVTAAIAGALATSALTIRRWRRLCCRSCRRSTGRSSALSATTSRPHRTAVTSRLRSVS